jgi:hypothetical protein
VEEVTKNFFQETCPLFLSKFQKFIQKLFPNQFSSFLRNKTASLTPIRNGRSNSWSSGIKFEGVKNVRYVGIPISEIKCWSGAINYISLRKGMSCAWHQVFCHGNNKTADYVLETWLHVVLKDFLCSLSLLALIYIGFIKLRKIIWARHWSI